MSVTESSEPQPYIAHASRETRPTERRNHAMADPTITRDILRGALNKHGDSGDTESFERVLNAMGGLEEEIARYRPARRA